MADFIIEKNTLLAYIGNPEVQEITIPDGVEIIGTKIFQQKINGDRGIVINLSKSVKRIEDQAFNCKCKQFNIPKDSQLEYIGAAFVFGSSDSFYLPASLQFFDSNNSFILKDIEVAEGCGLKEISSLPTKKIVKIPQNFNTVQNIKAEFIVIVPKNLNAFSSIKSKYVFFEGEVKDIWRRRIEAEFVYENIDPESVEFVDKTEECGIAYIKTSKGAVVTEIIEEKAQFEEIPEEVDGIKIYEINVIDFWNNKESEEKQKLGKLYPALRFFANKQKDEIEQTIKQLMSQTEKESQWRSEGFLNEENLPKENLPKEQNKKSDIKTFLTVFIFLFVVVAIVISLITSMISGALTGSGILEEKEAMWFVVLMTVFGSMAISLTVTFLACTGKRKAEASKHCNEIKLFYDKVAEHKINEGLLNKSIIYVNTEIVKRIKSYGEIERTLREINSLLKK